MAVRGLHHMGQRMRRPGVARIAGERLAAKIFRAPEVAGLFEPEGVKPMDEARQRIVAIPGRQHTRGAIANGGRAAKEEISVLREPQGERVGGMIVEDRLPAEDRARGLASRPRLGGGEVTPLTLRGAPNRRFGPAEGVHHLRMVSAKATDHVERRNRNAAQREIGIARER